MGTWAYNDQADFPIIATGDFQTVVCSFENWSVNAIGAHLLFCCGDFKGTTILKKIQVLDRELGATGSDICYNYINKGKIAEVIPHSNGKYYGAVDIPAKVMHEGVEYTVTKVADNAFNNCTKLTSINIPNSVTSIGLSAFSGCSGLSSVTILGSLTSIGGSAFSGCTSLTSITIPNSVLSIGSGAFRDCSGLTILTIGNSVISIGEDAFYGCSGLTSVIIPNSVNNISGGAFYGCTNLSTLTIGKSAQHIGVIAFGQCLQLNDVYCLIEQFENESLHDEPFDPNDFSRAVYKTRSYVETGLNISYDIFEGSYIEYATLHVPASAINTYMTTAPWSGFGEIVPISGEEIPKCATPTISYVNGEITFSCETEGVEYVSELSSSDVGNKYTDKVNITGKITVKVYATKSGYDKSDTAIAEIEVPGELKGDLNNDGTVNVADHVELTKIIMNEE